jgi:hypothetical protein
VVRTPRKWPGRRVQDRRGSTVLGRACGRMDHNPVETLDDGAADHAHAVVEKVGYGGGGRQTIEYVWPAHPGQHCIFPSQRRPGCRPGPLVPPTPPAAWSPCRRLGTGAPLSSPLLPPSGWPLAWLSSRDTTLAKAFPPSRRGRPVSPSVQQGRMKPTSWEAERLGNRMACKRPPSSSFVQSRQAERGATRLVQPLRLTAAREEGWRDQGLRVKKDLRHRTASSFVGRAPESLNGRAASTSGVRCAQKGRTGLTFGSFYGVRKNTAAETRRAAEKRARRSPSVPASMADPSNRAGKRYS